MRPIILSALSCCQLCALTPPPPNVVEKENNEINQLVLMAIEWDMWNDCARTRTGERRALIHQRTRMGQTEQRVSMALELRCGE